MKYRNDKRYLGLSNMIDKDNKSIYGLEFSYETIPNELNLFDYDAFKQYKGDFYCVVTNLLTGQPEYMKYTGDDRTNTVLKATCALPMLFPPIIINDVPYMDGGLSDSIPYLKAIEDGCDRLSFLQDSQATLRQLHALLRLLHILIETSTLSLQKLCLQEPAATMKA